MVPMCSTWVPHHDLTGTFFDPVLSDTWNWNCQLLIPTWWGLSLAISSCNVIFIPSAARLLECHLLAEY